MSRVIVAVAEPGDVRELIRAGHAIAALWDAETVAVHVTESAPAEMAADLRRQDATLEIHPGEPLSVIRRLAGDDDVRAVVLGTGDESGLSRFARALITELPTPVLVVPPGSVTVLRRVLVPLRAGAEDTRALARWLSTMRAQGVELRLLHVHAPAVVPAFADHEPPAGEFSDREFLAPRLAVAVPDQELVREVGHPPQQIAARCRSEVADMVMLSWNGALGDGRAPIVSEVLAGSRIPVLLLPADG